MTQRRTAAVGAASPSAASHAAAGTGTSGRANRALFVAGFSAFAMLYVAQGTLPAVGRAFHVSPATSALTVSLTTLPLALGVVVAASISERYGRRGLLLGSLLAASVCTLATTLSPSFEVLLGLRVLTGVALAALPAVAMAYIAEEVQAGSLGSTMGLYISATGLGGLAGRLIGGVLAGIADWRLGYLGVGILALLGSLYVTLRLPASRHFVSQPEQLLPQIQAAGCTFVTACCSACSSAASVCTLATTLSPSFEVLLGLRVLTGVALAALPAVAMAYIAEEVQAGSLGSTMGLYISATGLGGLAGRLIGGVLAGIADWRLGYLGVGILALLGSLYVTLRLPASRHFVSQPEQLLPQIQAAGVHLRDGVLQRLFVCGFTLMGAMVAYFNFLLYRLEAPPFDLTASGAALVFLLYLAGTVSANWLGRLADRRSRRSLLLTAVAMMLGGVLLTLPSYLPTVLIGTGLVTFGFFGAHATTSGWVGAHATHRRAQASSLYLLFYHLGSSLLGFAGGLAYGVGGWNGLVLLVTVAAGVALLAARGLPQLVMPTTRDTVGSEP